MRSAAEAAEFFTRLRDILVWLGVNDGNMEEGSLRCDANVSVRPAGQAEARHQGGSEERQFVPLPAEGASSTRSTRQIDLVESGGRVVQETRLWDSATGRTHSMRSKEEAHDYRYFPEPDLPPLRRRRGAHRRACARRCRSCPRRGAAASSRSTRIPDYDAGVLTQSAALADYFEAVAARGGQREGREQLGHGRAAADAQGARHDDRRGAAARRRRSPA